MNVEDEKPLIYKGAKDHKPMLDQVLELNIDSSCDSYRVVMSKNFIKEIEY